MDTVAYPRLIKRVRAALIDSVLIPLAFFAGLVLVGMSGISHPLAKLALVMMPILALEPGLVAFTGGTVGHHLVRVRVMKAGGTGNINILAATLRFAVKLLLGWSSFIFILTTRRHQAVHDLVAGSRVVLEDAAGLPAHEVLAEREPDRAAYVYPSPWRRVAVIVGYGLLSSAVVQAVAALFVSHQCLAARRCTGLDELIVAGLDILWLIGIGWVVVQGWNGMLYGCRRRRRESTA